MLLSEQDLDNIAKAVKALDRKPRISERSETSHATSSTNRYFRDEPGRSWRDQTQGQDLLQLFHRRDEPQQGVDNNEAGDQEYSEDYDESWALKQARLDEELQREREQEEKLWREQKNKMFEPHSRGKRIKVWPY